MAIYTKEQLEDRNINTYFPNAAGLITALTARSFNQDFIDSIYNELDNVEVNLGALSVWDNTKIGDQSIDNNINFNSTNSIIINSQANVCLNTVGTVKVPSTYTVSTSVDLTDKKYVDNTLATHALSLSIHRALNDGQTSNANLWSACKINNELVNKATVTEFDNHVNTANIHRVQCDTTIATTQLWSSQKIYDELYLKADSSCLTNLVTTDTFQSISGSKIFSNSISFTGAVSVPTPTVTTHAVRKSYVDDNFTTLSTAQSISGVKTFTGDINLNNSVTMPFRGTAGTDRIYQSLQGVNANNATNENSGAFIQFRTSTAAGYGAQIGGHRLSGGNSKLVVKTGGMSVTPTMSVDNNGNLRATGDIIAYSTTI